MAAKKKIELKEGCVHLAWVKPRFGLNTPKVLVKKKESFEPSFVDGIVVYKNVSIDYAKELLTQQPDRFFLVQGGPVVARQYDPKSFAHIPIEFQNTAASDIKELMKLNSLKKEKEYKEALEKKNSRVVTNEDGLNPPPPPGDEGGEAGESGEGDPPENPQDGPVVNNPLDG